MQFIEMKFFETHEHGAHGKAIWSGDRQSLAPSAKGLATRATGSGSVRSRPTNLGQALMVPPLSKSFQAICFDIGQVAICSQANRLLKFAHDLNL
jgi:hypothetical protein